MSHQRGVFMVCDDYAGDAFGSGICVESIGLLFDILSLARSGAFGDGFGEDAHEFADAATGEAGEGGQVALGAEFDGGFVFILEDLLNVRSEGGGRGGGCVRRCRGSS